MKILYLCTDPGVPVLGRKGASVHVRSFVAALVRAGHSVVLAAPRLTKSPWEIPATLEAPILHLPSDHETLSSVLALKAFNETLGVSNSMPGELRRILYNKYFAVELTHRFESDPPDFIYERAALYGTAGIMLGCELRVPVLVEVNAPLALEQSTYRANGLGELAELAERWTLSRADAVLAVSAPLRDHVVSLGVEPGRVHVVPNGVDPALFRPGPPRPEVHARWSLGGGPILGFVGGLRRWHDVEALPTLLERLVVRYRDLRLVIVGNGPLGRELERGLQARGLTRHAVFTGSLPHEDVAELIRHFDVALAPYPRLEHAFYFSPLKVFEYMACGVAVVAAAAGQITEVVRDGESGLLYPPGDSDTLLAACDRLLRDETLRQRVGAAAAKEIHSHYTWGHNAERVAHLAHSLTRARHA